MKDIAIDAQAYVDHEDRADAKVPFKSVCPVHRALVIVGDKWTLLLIRDLFFRHCRYYGDFLKGKEKISSNILASRLQKLETEGIVVKKPVPGEPSRCGYFPTAKAVGLVPVIVEMMVWADEYYPVKPSFQPSAWTSLKEQLSLDKPAAIAQLMSELAALV